MGIQGQDQAGGRDPLPETQVDPLSPHHPPEPKEESFAGGSSLRGGEEPARPTSGPSGKESQALATEAREGRAHVHVLRTRPGGDGLLEGGENGRLNQVVGEEGSARKALERLDELSPDVIVLDITMPGLSGLDAKGLALCGLALCGADGGPETGDRERRACVLRGGAMAS